MISEHCYTYSAVSMTSWHNYFTRNNVKSSILFSNSLQSDLLWVKSIEDFDEKVRGKAAFGIKVGW